MNKQSISLKRDILVGITVVVVGLGGGLGMNHMYSNMGGYIDQAVAAQAPVIAQPAVAKK